MDFNPYLNPEEIQKGTGCGKGFIETPGDVRFNMVHQTRAAIPSEYEDALCDALQKLFSQEITDAEGLVKGLNEAKCLMRDGETWTVASFKVAMINYGETGA